MEIPSGLDHVKSVTVVGEHNRRLSASKLGGFKAELEVIGISLNILYQTSTCHRKCFGGPHVLEYLTGRAYNLACSSYMLICRGFYDEALNLVRSLGEISNLVGMSVVDKEALQRWLGSDTKTRIREFGPAKVRKLLASQGTELMYADDDWYSKFCEDYTHVHPGTKPNVHNDEGQAHVGGFVQQEGMEYAIGELMNVCARVATLVGRYADLEDLLSELREAIHRSE